MAAGACSNASFTGIANEIAYLALDDDGPLVGFFSEFECAKVNPKLAKLVKPAKPMEPMKRAKLAKR